MPHEIDVRVIEMSRSPPLMNESASLRLVSGVTKPGCCVVVLEQAILEGAQTKEPVLLFHLGELAPVDRAASLDRSVSIV